MNPKKRKKLARLRMMQEANQPAAVEEAAMVPEPEVEDPTPEPKVEPKVKAEATKAPAKKKPTAKKKSVAKKITEMFDKE